MFELYVVGDSVTTCGYTPRDTVAAVFRGSNLRLKLEGILVIWPDCKINSPSEVILACLAYFARDQRTERLLFAKVPWTFILPFLGVFK